MTKSILSPRCGQPGCLLSPQWPSAGKRYHALSFYLRQVFGGPVRKVSIDAGFGCPNRDGTVGRDGCIFCNPVSFSPSRRLDNPQSVAQQICEAAGRLRRRHGTVRLLAYFQPGSNTYAPASRLRAAYWEALREPGVVGIVLGTRPDCLPDEVLNVLAELASQTWLSVEMGLQSIHEESLKWMRRGHDYQEFPAAVEKCRKLGIRVGAHVILGLPGESSGHVHATARELARLKIDAVKVHNLHAVEGTELARRVKAGRATLPEQDEYVNWVVDFLERLHPECVIDRLVGEAPREFLVGPAWCAQKGDILAAIEAEFNRRGTCQGVLSEQ